MASAEGRWRLVHLVLAAASLLGIGAVIALWLMAVRGRSGVLAWIGDLGLVFGVAEAALLVLAAIGLVFTNPGFHAPAQYPLLFVLVVFASLALRWLTGEAATAGRSPAGPAARDAPAALARAWRARTRADSWSMMFLPARPGTAELPTWSAGVAGQPVASSAIRRAATCGALASA